MKNLIEIAGSLFSLVIAGGILIAVMVLLTAVAAYRAFRTWVDNERY